MSRGPETRAFVWKQAFAANVKIYLLNVIHPRRIKYDIPRNEPVYGWTVKRAPALDVAEATGAADADTADVAIEVEVRVGPAVETITEEALADIVPRTTALVEDLVEGVLLIMLEMLGVMFARDVLNTLGILVLDMADAREVIVLRDCGAGAENVSFVVGTRHEAPLPSPATPQQTQEPVVVL